MTFEEMAAVVAEAHNYHRKVTGHCRATQGIKNALRAGFDCLEHGTFMDHEALDLLLERNTPVVPALQFEYASIEKGPEFGMPQAVVDGHKETLEGGAESARMILKAGGRLGMGGDYGFAWNPHGDYAKELTFFVKSRRIHAAGNDHLRDQDRRRDHGTRRTSSARSSRASWPTSWSSTATCSPTSRVLEDRSRFIAVMQGGMIKAGRLATSPSGGTTTATSPV